MTADKLKQYIAFFGGFLGTLYLFFQSIGVDLVWFNQGSIDSFVDVLIAAIPFILIAYGLYKNTYLITKQARKQEEELKRQGLK